ncbi:TRAP transporter substrate-binding protein [Polaromonas hydrogenivorans]|uniref:TRAP transporter substrate-binding protein n=1 Tax=Polaromonas hydrogenivorans TaxID=335476 RepID=A0AAU7LT71_9BURK
MIKKIRFSILRALLVLGFAAHAPAGHAQSIALTMVHGAPVDHPVNLAALQFAKHVERRTGGQIKVEVYPANQLGSPSEQLQKVKLGTVDMALPSQGDLSKYEKAFSVVLLPYVFDSYEHAHRVLDGPAMAWLAPLAEKQGFILLNNWEWGFRNLTNNLRPINKPEDIRGLKVRVPPGIEYEATMEALGGVITKISFAELRPALAQGVVDGQETPISVIYFNKYYEVQKHLALTRHVYYNFIHTINARSWARLSPAQQAIVREESKATSDAVRKAIITDEDALIAKLERLGMQVTRPDLKAFRAMVEPARKQISAHAGEANVQRFMKMAEDARKK